MNLETLSQILDLKDDFLKIPWIIGDKWVHASKDDWVFRKEDRLRLVEVGRASWCLDRKQPAWPVILSTVWRAR